MKNCAKIVILVLFLQFSICFSLLFVACNNYSYNENDKNSNTTQDKTNVKDFSRNGFSVSFLDVGEGDAIFINFGDGKTMLIDCGESSSFNRKVLKRYLNEFCKNGLDYFLLTHIDTDHIGNAEYVLSEVNVKKAFIPDIAFPQNFYPYNNIYSKIISLGIQTEKSAVFSGFSGENYTLIFLSPNAKGTFDSSYDIFNAEEDPAPIVRNNLSPIVYLDYAGVRFIFTGDAGKSQEKVALNNVKTGLIDRFFKRENAVNLKDIDFLKVSHHGGDEGSGEDFLSEITPKNAVISVGGDNFYGHPSTETLTRIYTLSTECTVYKTSDCGTVTVYVNDSGEYKVTTELS